MSVKRRDSKKRILRNGESQRKDGRYAYVYVDRNNKQQFLYSWKLEPTDRAPQGKRDCVSLREKIKQINKDIEDNINPTGEKITVLQLVEKCTSQRGKRRYHTQCGYSSFVSTLEKDPFSKQYIENVRISDAKKWIISLQKNGLKYNTICGKKIALKLAFKMAVDDNLIRKNPFDFPLNSVISNNTIEKQALTEEEEADFLSFIKEDAICHKYYNEIYILFNTGLRMSEFIGLTKKDIDLDNNRINVTHQLIKTRNTDYILEKPKTKNGVRIIPMSKEVRRCFEEILKNRPNPPIEFTISGQDNVVYTNFLFLNRHNVPRTGQVWCECFERICKRYNAIHESHPLKVTPHICRHTFCSNMVKKGMNPKALQYIMGHSNIAITLNVYTHINSKNAQEEFTRVMESDA